MVLLHNDDYMLNGGRGVRRCSELVYLCNQEECKRNYQGFSCQVFFPRTLSRTESETFEAFTIVTCCSSVGLRTKLEVRRTLE
jgi:hypothetical protein